MGLVWDEKTGTVLDKCQNNFGSCFSVKKRDGFRDEFSKLGDFKIL